MGAQDDDEDLDVDFKEMYDQLDANSDGKLEIEEVWTSLQEELEEEFGEDVPKELKDLLTKADVDSNGEISSDEMMSFVQETQTYLEGLEDAEGDDEMEPEDEV